MTSLDEFQGNIQCNKINPIDIDAFFELSLDPINTSTLKLQTSWGCTAVDLAPVVKTSETVTHLFITPEGSLQYNREDYGQEGVADGGLDCITGDELSRIISMRLLKDVDQTQQIKNGMVYLWDDITNLFEPYNLQGFVNTTDTTLENHTASINVLQTDIQALQNSLALLTKRVTNLETRMTNLENRVTVVEGDVTNLKSRVSSIEGAIYNWSNDKTTKIPRGTINVYGDPNGTGTSQSILSHSPSTNVNGDQRFA